MRPFPQPGGLQESVQSLVQQGSFAAAVRLQTKLHSASLWQNGFPFGSMPLLQIRKPQVQGPSLGPQSLR
jgi:hypothetical protein